MEPTIKGIPLKRKVVVSWAAEIDQLEKLVNKSKGRGKPFDWLNPMVQQFVLVAKKRTKKNKAIVIVLRANHKMNTVEYIGDSKKRVVTPAELDYLFSL